MSKMLKGVRYQKRISLGKFMRLNISKTGIGLSVGVRGLRYSVGPSGSYLTVGLPGSGIRYQRKMSDRKGFQFASLKNLVPGKGSRNHTEKERFVAQSTEPEPEPALEREKPGLFAPRWEKSMVEGLSAYRAGDQAAAIRHLWDAVEDEAVDLGAMILLAYLLAQRDRARERAEAIGLLEGVISSDAEFPSRHMARYMPDITLDIAITPQVAVRLPIENGLAASLLLVEEYQEAGELQNSIDLLEEINEVIAEGHNQHYDEVITLSLSELYLATENYQAIINSVEPPEAAENDVLLGILFFYARALQEQGLHTGAFQVFTKALRRKKGLSPNLLQACRLWRAMSYLKTNKRSKARQELERVLAETSDEQLKRSAIQTIQAFWPAEKS